MATLSGNAATRFVAYYRVSTGRQTLGYGVEAQRADVRRYVDDNGGALVGEYFEAVSGRRSDRPMLAEALRCCRLKRATLVVARLDRLARNVAFVTALTESDQKFVVVDFPAANRFTIHILAAIAEYESDLISVRVKEALAAARARGTKLGRPKGDFPGRRGADNSASVRARAAKSAARARDLAPIVWDLVGKGFSRKSIAGELDRLGIKSARGRPWNPSSVDFVLQKTRTEFGSSPEIARAAALGPRLVRSELRTRDLAPLMWDLRSRGMTIAEIADEMTRLGIPTRKKGRWHRRTVTELLKRTESAFRALAATAAASLARRPQKSAVRDRARERALAVAPLIWSLRAAGKSTRAIAEELNRDGAPAARTRWGSVMVARVIKATATEFGDIATSCRPVRRTVPAEIIESREARMSALAPVVWGCLCEGRTRLEIAGRLNQLGLTTPRGLAWTEAGASRLVKAVAERDLRDVDAASAVGLRSDRLRWTRMARDLGPRIQEARRVGKSYDAIAAQFSREAIPTLRGKRWHGVTVTKLLRFAERARIAPRMPTIDLRRQRFVDPMPRADYGRP